MIEVADILKNYGQEYIEQYKDSIPKTI